MRCKRENFSKLPVSGAVCLIIDPPNMGTFRTIFRCEERNNRIFLLKVSWVMCYLSDFGLELFFFTKGTIFCRIPSPKLSNLLEAISNHLCFECRYNRSANFACGGFVCVWIVRCFGGFLSTFTTFLECQPPFFGDKIFSAVASPT